MNRWSIGIAVSAVAGVASFLFFPEEWILPAFGVGVAAALLAAIAARSDTKPRHPVGPLTELALFAVNLPPDPLAEVPNDWPLWAFAVSTIYLLSLFIAIFWAAHA